MNSNFDADLKALTEAWHANRSADTDRRLISLLQAASPLATFFDVWASLEAESGNAGAAADRLLALRLLRPNEIDVRRRQIMALLAEGHFERFDEELRQVDITAFGFDFFLWGLETHLQVGNWRNADEAVAAARLSGRFKEADLLVAEAQIMFQRGLDLTAMDIVTSAIRLDGTCHHAKRMLARMLEATCDVTGATIIRETLAIDGGMLGDLEDALIFRLAVFEFDKATAAVDAASNRWPHIRSASDRLKAKIAAGRTAAEAAVKACGSIEPFDRDRIYAGLRTYVSPQEILWARQSLAKLVASPELRPEDADRFMGVSPNWENFLVVRHLLHSFLRCRLDNPSILTTYLRFMTVDEKVLQSVLRGLADLDDAAFGEDMAFTAIFYVRQVETGYEFGREVLAPLLSELRSKVGRFLHVADPSFLTFAAAQVEKLGLDMPSSIKQVDTEKARAVQAMSIIGQPPWQTARKSASHARHTVRDPSTAVAISGQLRGFSRAWPSINRQLVQPLRAPVFMSVWDTSQNAIGRHAKRLERVLPRDLLMQLVPTERYTDIFQQKFPETSELLFAKQAVNVKELETKFRRDGVEVYTVETEDEDVYNRIVCESDSLASHSLLKMFAKMSRLEALISSYEVQVGKAFSHVAWVRPDAAVRRLNPRVLMNATHDLECGWGEVSPTAVGDYFFVVPRRAFSAIAKVFPSAVLLGDIPFYGWMPLSKDQSTRIGLYRQLRGPESIAFAVFSAGFAMQMLRGCDIELLGYIPPLEDLRRSFFREFRQNKR